MDSNEFEIRKQVSNLQMRAALITALSILFAGCLLFLLCGKDTALFIVLMTLMVASIAGVSAIRYTLFCRNSILGGYMSYFRSVRFGSSFFLLSGMVITLGVYLFFHFHPNFFIDFFNEVELQYQSAVESGVRLTMTHEELAKQRELILSMSTFSLASNFGFTYLFVGALSSLVYSLFLMKNPKNS